MVRRWLRLPHDTSIAAIHAPIPEGGLGLFSTIATSKKLNESRLLNVEGIGGDEDGATIIRSPHVLQIMEPKFIKAYIDTSTRDLHKHLDTQGSDVAFFILPCRLFLSWRNRIRQALDCSPTDRERELGLDRRETG